jgi:hypothetical protein
LVTSIDFYPAISYVHSFQVSNCEESVSAELSTKEIALCQKEAKKVLELVIADEERAREEAVAFFI